MQTRYAVLRVFPGWIGSSVAVATAYGILNDQLTISFSPEYFSVFKRQQFAPLLTALGLANAPTRLQAVAVGVAATWWFGLFLGIVLSTAGIVGRSPRLTTRDFFRAVRQVILVTAAVSCAFGAFAYLVFPDPGCSPLFMFLCGIRNTHAAFAVGAWHDGAYLGAFVGTLSAGLRVQHWRKRYPMASAS